MTSAFAANSVCSPNRASLMTGRYPSAHGVRCNGTPLSQEEITLPQVLSANGYATGSFGKIHLQPTRVLTCCQPYQPNSISYESLHYWIDAQKELWNDKFWNPADMFPLPYYGFQEVELTIGHTGHVTFYGHYGQWLKHNHPEMVGADTKLRALPGGVGAALSWKSALPAELHSTNWAVDRTIDFLDRQQRDGRNFCAFCSIPDPHHAFAPPAPYCNMYDDADIQVPLRHAEDLENKPPHYLSCYEGDNRVHGMPAGFARGTPDSHYREVIAHTYGMVSLIDDAVGRLLKHLDDNGLADNTIVLFTSDHGDLMGDHGLMFKGPLLLDGCVRVPMIWRLPGKNNPSGKCEGLSSTVDIMPTILDAAGIDTPAGVQGHSQLPVLTRETDTVRDHALIEYDEEEGIQERLRCMVTDHWKIIVYGGRDYGELYDRINDPGEFVNLWDDEKHWEIKQELKEALLHKLIERDDTLPPKYCPA